MQSKPKGFTLIELMITVAIIGILAAIAYPSYQEYIIKSRRTDATGNLMAFAHILERCYTSYGAYNNANCSIVDGTTLTVPATDSQEGYYSISSTALTATTFTLQATPAGTQANDDLCASLTIANTGQREAEKTGGADSSEDCWKD